jgi:hypothetical protein
MGRQSRKAGARVRRVALLYLEAIGPRGEELALAAGDAMDIPVGFDRDLNSATFDADSLELEELKTTVVEALAGLDPDWQSHLQVIDE